MADEAKKPPIVYGYDSMGCSVPLAEKAARIMAINIGDGHGIVVPWFTCCLSVRGPSPPGSVEPEEPEYCDINARWFVC